MALPTFSEVAERYGLDICPACTTYSRYGHREGLVDMTGTIHWGITRVTRASLYRFMVAIGRRRAFTSKDDNEVITMWQLLYRANKWAYETALRDFRIRFARSLAAEDRAKVRWYLRHKPALASPSDAERLAAARWAEERRP